MRKLLKIISVTIVVVISLIVVTPFVFKNRIIEYAITELNRNLNATISFSKVSVDPFRSFPDLRLGLNELLIISKAPFEGDTFMLVRRMHVTFDIFSMLKGNPYEAKKIALSRPYLNLLIKTDGTANWDAILPVSDAKEGAIADTSQALVLRINELAINEGRVNYDDQEIDMQILLNEVGGKAKGALSEKLSNLLIQAQAESLSVIYHKTAYLDRIKASYEGLFDIDLLKDYYTLRNSKINLNQLELVAEGGFGFVGDDISIDLSFNSMDQGFKNLLSVVPVVYNRQFDKLQAQGMFTFNGWFKGLYGDTSFPGFGLNLKVDQGAVQYAGLPGSATSIHLDLAVVNSSGLIDDTQIKIPKASLLFDGNPVQASLILKSPVSDPYINLDILGRVDLSRLEKVFPLADNQRFTGIVDVKAALDTRLSHLTQKRYGLVNATGYFHATNVSFGNSWNLKPFSVEMLRLDFSPAVTEMAMKELNIGSSTLDATGRLQHYLGYLLSNENLMADLSVNAAMIDVDQLLDLVLLNEFPIPDTAKTGAVIPKLPSNIEAVFQLQADSILYKNYRLGKALAKVNYKDGVVQFNPLESWLLGGKVELSGTFDARGPEHAWVDLDIRISDFNIAKSYKSMGLLQAAVPVAERTRGSFSTGLLLKGKFDNNLNPVYESLQGGGLLKTSAISITTVETLNRLGDLFGNNDYKELTTQGVDLAFQFINGKLFQQPFTIKWAGTTTTVSGFVGFDKIINLDLVFQVPFEKFGPGANQAMQRMATEAARKGINVSPDKGLIVKVNLGGSILHPTITLDYRSAVADIKTQLQQAAILQLEQQKEEFQQKISEQAQRLLDEAKLQGDALIAQAGQAAARIRAEAAAASEKILKEAEIRVQRVEEEARKKGPLAEAAAREVTRRIRQEASNLAQKTIAEADKQAENILAESQKQADDLMTKAREKAERL